jgi:hypothetical protein
VLADFPKEVTAPAAVEKPKGEEKATPKAEEKAKGELKATPY